MDDVAFSFFFFFLSVQLLIKSHFFPPLTVDEGRLFIFSSPTAGNFIPFQVHVTFIFQRSSHLIHDMHNQFH